MSLIKLIVAIQYRELPSRLDYRSKLLNIIDASKNQKIPQFAESLDVKVKKKKMLISTGANKTGLEINQPESVEEAKKEVLGLFKKINGFVNFGNINAIGVRSMWISKRSESIEDFIKIYKAKFYKENNLVDKAQDVGVFLTFSDGNRKINFMSGPMGKEQLLKMYLRTAPFDDSLLPEVFSFVDYDYHSGETNSYSDKNLEKFVNHAVDMAMAESNKVENILGG